jgi:hypothetical protein
MVKLANTADKKVPEIQTHPFLLTPEVIPTLKQFKALEGIPKWAL